MRHTSSLPLPAEPLPSPVWHRKCGTHKLSVQGRERLLSWLLRKQQLFFEPRDSRSRTLPDGITAFFSMEERVSLMCRQMGLFLVAAFPSFCHSAVCGSIRTTRAFPGSTVTGKHLFRITVEGRDYTGKNSLNIGKR